MSSPRVCTIAGGALIDVANECDKVRGSSCANN